jgi:ubiquinone/menaquinone biosynthesis C-methylase UbiE
MQSTFNPAAITDFNPLRTAYETLQWGKSVLAMTHKNAASRVGNFLYPRNSESPTRSMPPSVFEFLQQRYQALLAQDWEDAQAGFYPVDLLFDTPWEEVVRQYPVLWLDLPQMWRRTQTKRCQEFADDIDTSGYPPYYLQNFHYQTDGYLSDTSADLYDLQVELLFSGMADPMRRRILPLLKQQAAGWALGGQQPLGVKQHPKILDVACGTGRTLRQLRAAFPTAMLYGIDLSPTYLQKANQLLSQKGELPQLLQANAESLPYQANYFNGVTSVFLFHELPTIVRQKVIEECYRVLQPGGTLIICDSIQRDDSAELGPMMENFATVFHEPYYSHYIQDNLVQRLEQAGFEAITSETHFLSKYLTARKGTAE